MNKIRVVYIGGSARSGTGILGRVLSKIDQTAHGGELRRLWSHGIQPGQYCDCGRSHEECPIWSKLLVPGANYIEPSLADLASVQKAAAPKVHSWWHALKILRRHSRANPTSTEAHYLKVYSDLYKAFAHATSSSVVLDNSKNPADAALLASESNVTVFCIQIVRDPRGVLFSRRKRSMPNDPSQANPIETVKTAVYWMLRQLTFGAIRRRYGPERSSLVIYERLVEDPNPTLHNISHLLGEKVPAEELQTGVPLSMPEVHGPDGGIGRFSPTQVILKEDSRWRRELHPIDRRLMTILTYPFLQHYGYPIRTNIG